MEIDFERVFDVLPAMAWTTRPDGRIDSVNQHWSTYVGADFGGAGSWAWEVLIAREELPAFLESWRSILASGEPGCIQASVRRSDGRYRRIRMQCSPVRGDAGRILRWCGVGTDIDDAEARDAPQADEAAEAGNPVPDVHDPAESAQALRRSELHFRQIVDDIAGLIFVMTSTGEIELVNRQSLEYFGKTFAELKDWANSDAVHPDDLPYVIAAWFGSVEAERPFDAEYRLRRFDGSYRWFRVHALPARDAEGRIVRWYCLKTDIDDRKRAEALLAGEKHLLEMMASGRLLRDVLLALCRMVEETASDCHCVVHPIDGKRLTFEEAVAPSLPPSFSAPVVGQPINSEIFPCGAAVLRGVLVIVPDITTDMRWNTTFVRTHFLEHGLRAAWSMPICSKEGRILGTLCIVRRDPASPSPDQQNIIARAAHMASIAIEHSRTEAELRRKETLLAEGQQLSSTGSFSWKVDTDEIEVSGELCRILGFDPESILDWAQIHGRIHPEDLPLVMEQMARVCEGHAYLNYDFRLRMPDERIKYLRSFGRVIRHDDGRLECLAAVQDMTERRLADEALGKARGELAHVARVTSLNMLTASIAHEVNQPLAGIVTNAGTCLRILAADPPNLSVAQDTARRIIRDANRAADVIARLRALFSKRSVSIEPVDLNEAAREVLVLQSNDLQRSRVVLRTELDETLPLVAGERVPLQQVIMNLLRNALDAMEGIEDRPRHLVIRTGQDEDGQVRLSVEDTGLGFEGGETERVFEAFYTTKAEGMGIGLSVSRCIMESYCGRLWARRNEGLGVTFCFSVPIHPEGGKHDDFAAPAPSLRPRDTWRLAKIS